jgi:hypothetical protein
MISIFIFLIISGNRSPQITYFVFAVLKKRNISDQTPFFGAQTGNQARGLDFPLFISLYSKLLGRSLVHSTIFATKKIPSTLRENIFQTLEYFLEKNSKKIDAAKPAVGLDDFAPSKRHYNHTTLIFELPINHQSTIQSLLLSDSLMSRFSLKTSLSTLG